MFRNSVSLLPSVLLLLVAGCGGGGVEGEGSSPAGGGAGPSSANRAPQISGTPATSATVGQSYSFTPLASDPDNDSLIFSVTGLPRWARFNSSTGSISGTPGAGDVGLFTGIGVSVSDGRSSIALAAFSIEVKPVPGGGTATLSWVAPSSSVSGSALASVAGFRVYHGTQEGLVSPVALVQDPLASSYVFDGLSAGTHYFAVSALDGSGEEGPLSEVLSKVL